MIAPFVIFYFFVVCISAIPGKGIAETNNSRTKPELISLYTYHTHPPFQISQNKGLSYDLADYLTQRSKGRYEFAVKPMSRPRVDKMLDQAQSGVIPWVNPVWFKDVKEDKYMWTQGVFMEDGNAIISHQKKRIIYEGPETLKGLLFGGLRGHFYQGIDDYIKETHQRVRVDAENHIDNFRKLTKQRIDVTLMPESGALYYINQANLSDVLFVSPKLHTQFQRRAIIINKRKDILEFLEMVSKEMGDDLEWKNIMTAYQ